MEKGIEGKQNIDVIFRNIILTSNDTRIVKQETSMSEPAPVRPPGQPPHEVVFAPLCDVVKVWFGKATFAASQLKLRYYIFTIHGKI
jgi:hypothetical protein